MDSAEQYDMIAALEARLQRVNKIVKELEREKSLALSDVDRANTRLYELEEEGNQKDEEVARLREKMGELESDLRDERQTVSDLTDDLQKAYADRRKLHEEYRAVAQARNEVETRQQQTQQQLDQAREQLQRMQGELDDYGALQKAVVDAERAQAELYSEIAVLHEMGNPEQRKILILTERNTVLEKENSSLTRDNRLLQRAVKGQEDEKLTPEEVAQLAAAPSPAVSSLAEELDGLHYEDDSIDYDSDSSADSPIEMLSVATQTESLPLPTTCSAARRDAPRPTVAMSTQTDVVEVKAVSTMSTQTDAVSTQRDVSTQTDNVAASFIPTASPVVSSTCVSTGKEGVERTEAMWTTDGPLSQEAGGSFFNNGPASLVALVLTCWVIVVMRVVDGVKRANGGGIGHDYGYDHGYGYGYGYGHIQGDGGAYGNGRYLFNTIPMAMGLGSLEGLAGFSSRCIAGLEKWAGSEPALLY